MTIRWAAAGGSDVGRVRRGNEDSYFVDVARGVFAVADGMGGHAAGEVASSIAAEAAGATLGAAVDAGGSGEQITDALQAAFQHAWQEIVRCCDEDPRKDGMGTTLTACVVTPAGNCYIGHIGDSRAYRIRNGSVDLLTHDHTWVQREVDAGRMDSAAAETHPFSHILTRVLSADLPPQPDVLELEVESGDLLLLTSDGLHGLVPASQIAREAALGTPEPDIVAALIRRANRRGGRDNITAVAIRILPNGG